MPDFPTANIEGLFLTEDAEDSYTSPRTPLLFDGDGVVDDERHRGRFRPADVRLRHYVKREDLLLNMQQVSLVEEESLDFIGDELGIKQDVVRSHSGEDRKMFMARCLGANILLGGFDGTETIKRFHALPNATHFGPYDPARGKFTAATVMIMRYNPPCAPQAQKLQDRYPITIPDVSRRFIRAAQERRGFVGMVVKAGQMTVGDTVTFVPLSSLRD